MASLKLRIPKKHHAGLAKYLKLGEESFGSLMTNLEGLPFTLDFGEPLRKAVKSADGVPSSDAVIIADALISVYIGWSNSDTTKADFINDIVGAITESTSDDFAELLANKDTVWSRLTRLFDVQSLTLAVKARSVISEFDNVFKTGRVLTDVRPVFGDKGNEAQALTVIHNLRIHYHRGDKPEDFFVALDSLDLRTLINSLRQAKDRGEALKAMLASTNIPHIEIE